MLAELSPNVQLTSSPYKQFAVPTRIKLKSQKQQNYRTPQLICASEGSSSTVPSSCVYAASSPCPGATVRKGEKKGPSKIILQPESAVLIGRKTPSPAVLVSHGCKSFKLLPLAARNASRAHAIVSWEHGLQVIGQNGLLLDGVKIYAGSVIDLQHSGKNSITLDFYGALVTVQLPVRPTQPQHPSSDLSMESLSSDEEEDVKAENVEAENIKLPANTDIEGHLITTLVFSARSTLAFGELLEAARQIHPKSDVALVRHVLDSGPFESVEIIKGTIAKDHKVEGQYYYAVAKDTDAARVATLRPFVKEVRASLRSRKTYYVPKWNLKT